MDVETTETAVGTTSELATPCIARNMINCIPVSAPAFASMKIARKRQPTRLTVRAPIASAKDPAMSKVAPLAS